MQDEKNLKKVAKKGTEKEFTLPSGKVCVMGEFKGKHTRQANTMIDGDMSLYTFALIHILCTIDGRKPTIEELDDYAGLDIIAMQGKLM